MPDAALILASGSATRAHMLRAAGLTFTIVKPETDEVAAKCELRAAGIEPPAQAEALAERKAVSVSRAHAGLVIGADQILCLDGAPLDKPATVAEARADMRRLRGRAHDLVTAAVLAEKGRPVWRFTDRARLGMRDFSDTFLDAYLAQIGEGALTSVGAYQLEGVGAQLFDFVDGDFFSILGLPLLPLLAALRERGLAAQ